MYTIFHDGQIWDQYEDADRDTSRQTREPIPLYAWCYNDVSNRWSRWYHSWNPQDTRIHGALPPECHAFLLLLGVQT